ncbi:hypothetical protein AAFF_G00042360 [Aldrovandia affinis]|uniref:Uncharacterized protein n=1 Tax=Aldrovandia affinis TaxID=143900 RepID=A0AAD7S4Z4_9TELE|nr:hypothetical protein AAFF_G00042360 [Aldrovandia affinis]
MRGLNAAQQVAPPGACVPQRAAKAIIDHLLLNGLSVRDLSTAWPGQRLFDLASPHLLQIGYGYTAVVQGL